MDPPLIVPDTPDFDGMLIRQFESLLEGKIHSCVIHLVGFQPAEKIPCLFVPGVFLYFAFKVFDRCVVVLLLNIELCARHFRRTALIALEHHR